MLSPAVIDILVTIAIVQFTALFALIFLDSCQALKQTAISAQNRNAPVANDQIHVPQADRATERNFKMASAS